MTTFTQFAARCKIRHDFDDRIQVRYFHRGGEFYDTWVSGEEVEQRLRSESTEVRLRRLQALDLDEIRSAFRELPTEGKRQLGDRLQGRLADNVEDFLGNSLLGQSLADAVRGEGREPRAAPPARQRWQMRLYDTDFRGLVLELAWTNLRGSFPDVEDDTEFDDWV